jgi:lysophospholipase L1-like esterase
VRIAVFGDGIAAGEADRREGGWAGRLRKHVKAARPDSHVFNFGVGGEDSAALLERFEPQCLASDPSRIVIAIGIHDSGYGVDRTAVEPLRYSLNVERLIAQALGMTGDLLFVGLTRVDERRTMPISRRPLRHFENELIVAHDSVLQQICRSRGVAYVPMFDLLSEDDLADGLHPGGSGHSKMFERLLRFL